MPGGCSAVLSCMPQSYAAELLAEVKDETLVVEKRLVAKGYKLRSLRSGTIQRNREDQTKPEAGGGARAQTRTYPSQLTLDKAGSRW